MIAKNKNQNTFAKRQREHEKKRKAQDKLARRSDRKDTPRPSGELYMTADQYASPDQYSPPES